MATQIKYDMTGITVSIEQWLEMNIKDYDDYKDNFKIQANSVIDELGLNKSYGMK